MKRIAIILLLLLAGCQQPDYRNSVCQVWAYKKYTFDKQVICAKQGTGFLITPNLVLTCAHVVTFGSPSFMHRMPADSIICIFLSDTVLATVSDIDQKRDIAKLQLQGFHGTPLKVGHFELIFTSTQQFGSFLLVLGYPSGEWSAFPARAIEPDTSGDKIVALIDSHKSLGGASGSPVLYKGYVVGILQEQGIGGYTHKRFIRFRLLD